jgi:pimeloyl-ACP methyl ester carboxylesterase
MGNQNNQPAERTRTRRGRGCVIGLGALLAGLLVLLLAGSIYESRAEAADLQTYPPPGQMVDVGGYRLHINCTGNGSPTVVIEAGWGDWSSMWGLVQPGVAQTTRVCTYDRAGTGWSEPGPLPRAAGQFAKELHTLLQNANIPGSYVLVGHSLGGLPVRVFAHAYPSEVAGVVLIDSMYPGQSKHSPADTNTRTAAQTRTFSVLPLFARFGIVRLVARPLGLVTSVPFMTPQILQALVDEGQGIPDSLAQAGAVTTFGDLPLIVLSRGLDLDPGWQAGQAELLKLSSNSQHLIAEKSDHNIELIQPEAAVAAIVKMVEQLRK